MEPEIVFENDDVIVINKPVGLMVHADGHHDGETVVDWFLKRCPKAAGVGEVAQAQDGTALERSGVVHRLDRDTSGVMILAKNQDAFSFLKTQFQDRLVKKEYRALVYGPVREQWGTINKAIGRSPSDPRKRLAGGNAKGHMREAVTDWECIGSGRYQEEHFSYMKLLPKTGRTHQLRVHLKAICRPIVGDTLYAESEMGRSNNLQLERMALHAHRLQLVLPDGEDGAFIVPIPPEIEQAVDSLQDE
jgi:23S rRNA pseudouridine1911/1915/1917 synthase